jgi:hypothetical protein
MLSAMNDITDFLRRDRADASLPPALFVVVQLWQFDGRIADECDIRRGS